MPKVSGPLFSSEAHGTLKKVLTFSKRKTGQQVRFQRTAKDKLTEAREEQRNLFKEAVGYWNELNNLEKAEFNSRALAHKLTGYNLCLKEYIGRGGPPIPPGPIYGPELVLNNDFMAGWNSWYQHSGFSLLYPGISGPSFAYVKQQITPPQYGANYKLDISIKDGRMPQGSWYIRVYWANTGYDFYPEFSTGLLSATMIPTWSTNPLYIYFADNYFGKILSVSLKQILSP